jgi:hypothetical protein
MIWLFGCLVFWKEAVLRQLLINMDMEFDFHIK